MPVLIGLLRGVNVGGHNKIRMEELRGLCDSCGLCDTQTYVQSGNLVFRTTEIDIGRLAARLEEAIEKRYGFRPAVILRTASEMKAIVSRNPFQGRPGLKPSKLLVSFLSGDPGGEVRARIRAIPANPEEIHADGRELYIYFPHGTGRSKLMPLLERAMKIPATGRNWNTVTKLLEMAEGL